MLERFISLLELDPTTIKSHPNFAPTALFIPNSVRSIVYKLVICPKRNIDLGGRQRYRELLNSTRISRIYLDELGKAPRQSLGIATVELIVTSKDTAIALGKELIKRTNQEIEDLKQIRELLQLIETILVYKLPQLSRREVESIFSLSDLRQTKVYQEALEEGRQEGELQTKSEAVPRLLALG